MEHKRYDKLVFVDQWEILPVPRLCLYLVTSTWLANWPRFVDSKKDIDSAATPNGEMSRDVSRVADDIYNVGR